MQAATMATAEEEEGPGVAVDTIPPGEHLLDSSAAAAPQHDERLAEMEQAACAAVEEEVENDESKGMKRGRQDPENKEEVVEGELGDVDESTRIDEQEPVGKKAKTQVDNGDAELGFVEEQDRNGKAGDENVMDAEAKAKVEKPEAESEESGDQYGGDALGPSTDKHESTDVAPVQLGPKLFHSGAQMFTYFYDLLHGWVFDVDLNKYEKLVLSDLILKGHQDAERKIGPGIKAFQIKKHPKWRNRCYYLLRTDGSLEDFSYRKCVDKLMPLPPELFLPSGSLNLDELLPLGRESQKVADRPKGRDGQAGFRGSYEGRVNKGGGRKGGGHRGRGRFHHRR